MTTTKRCRQYEGKAVGLCVIYKIPTVALGRINVVGRQGWAWRKKERPTELCQGLRLSATEDTDVSYR